MSEIVLKVKNLKKYYKDVKAVDGVSFEVAKGEIFALLGPNGAGKTTTIKCILGFKRDFSGGIQINGKAAYLPETKALYKNYTVEKMIEVAKEMSHTFDKKKAMDMISGFELPLKEKIVNLSNGMRTMLYLSLTFAEDVDLYILDEPTWGLDPLMREKVLDMIAGVSAEGKAVLYTSHILAEVEKVAYKVAIMASGRIIEYGILDDIKEKYVAAYVGHHEKIDGFLYKETSDGKVYIVRKENAPQDHQPATFEMIFNSIVRSVKK